MHGKMMYLNVMNRLSVDCDCLASPTEPDMHDIGVLSSLDPVHSTRHASTSSTPPLTERPSPTHRLAPREHILEYAEGTWPSVRARTV